MKPTKETIEKHKLKKRSCKRKETVKNIGRSEKRSCCTKPTY
jgi:hypothetical protein